MSTPHPNRRRFCQQIAAGLALAPALSSAATFPERPMRIVVPFAPGAGTDAMGRLVAAKLSELFKVNVVVENRTGASGAIGAQEVAKSAPDGHTLLLAAAPFTTVAAALPTAGYDPVGGFVPVGMIAHGPLVWVANKDLPASTLPELIALAKKQPGALNYGSAGVGGINHLVLESLEARAGIYITHIPYRGIAPATLDTISGQLQLLTGTIPALAPHIRDGKLKALAVTLPARSAALPQVPTFAEAGLPRFSITSWAAVVGPARMPPDLVERWNREFMNAMARPEVIAAMERQAFQLTGSTPARLGSFMKEQLDSYRATLKAAGVEPE